jgi:hypothetical protein
MVCIPTAIAGRPSGLSTNSMMQFEAYVDPEAPRAQAQRSARTRRLERKDNIEILNP